MTGRLLLQKYSDWSIVLLEYFNAKRRFGFILNSSRNLYKMLWKEDVSVVSMSMKTWDRFVGAFDSMNLQTFGIAEDPYCLYGDFFGRACIIHEKMEDNDVFMVNGKGDAIVMKIVENQLDFS